MAGLGSPQLAERIEKRMVAREEGANIITTGTATTQDWDAAWESDGEAKEDPADVRNRQSIEEQRRASEVYSKSHWLQDIHSSVNILYWCGRFGCISLQMSNLFRNHSFLGLPPNCKYLLTSSSNSNP